MANINKIRLSGTTYNIEDENAAKSVTLTQAEYDALQTKDPNVFYIISDSSISYMTSGDTESAITQAVSGKQDTLVSGTNIKTINNQSLLGSGNISIQAGGISSVEADYDDSVEPNGEFDILINDGSSYSQIFVVGDGLQVTENNGNKILSATGGGISSGEVQTMIDSSISGKTNQSDFSAHTANTSIHVTTAQTAAWDAKSDFSGSYNDLTDKPTIPTVPTSNTAFTNDAGYITSDAISGKVDTTTYTAYTAATDTALSGKQDTLSAGTNITIVDNVISAEGGGSITIDPSLNTSSNNAVANSAITNAINSKVTNIVRGQANWVGSGVTTLNVNYTGTSETTRTFCASINKKQILTGSDYSKANQFSLVETSAITTSITSASTDVQVPSAKAVYDALQEGGGGNSVVELTQAEYDALVTGGTVDPDTFYVITDAQEIDSDNYYTTAQTQSAITQAVSGKADVSAVTTVNNALTAHTADTTIHVTTAQTAAWDAKQNALTIDSTVTSGSTNPVSGGAVYTQFGGLKLVKLTQAQYNALSTKDNNTLYVIVN